MTKLDIIKSFEEKRLLLIGDTILDVYSYGREVCKSSDSDAPEIEEEKISVSFGGASLVAQNILELGGHVVFFSVVGDDEAAKHYNAFSHPKLEKHFLVDKIRPTIVKKRFWVSGQKIFQANQVNNQAISSDLENKLIREMKPLIKNIEVMVVLDPQHGLMSRGLIGKLMELSQKYQKPLYVDSQISHKESNHYLYKGADCLFLNETEAGAIFPEFDIQNPEPSLGEIKKRLKVANVVVKLGGQGSIALFNNKYVKGEPHRAQVVDPCGAGDTFLAAFSLSNREAVGESLAIANTWAALSTTIHGTIPPKKQELINICQ